MGLPAATAPVKSLIGKLLFRLPPAPKKTCRQFSAAATASNPIYSTKSKSVRIQKQKGRAELLVKRRTRSERELDEEGFLKQYGKDNSAHVPVLLGEVLDVFASARLKSFVDCTLGAGGHSAAIIQAHPELEFYVGLDIDPVAHQLGQARINTVSQRESGRDTADLQVHTLLKNFRSIKTVLDEIGAKNVASGVEGILMDLGMSSMQVNNAERGFSVLVDGPLDMRMDPEAGMMAG